jgi:beta-mannosidase
MPSHPALPTVTNGIIDPSSPNYNRERDEHPQSFPIAHHIKAHSFEKRMLPYVFENLRHNPSPSMTYLEQEILLTQLVQAEALSHAYRGWRRKWGSRHCGGALVWQLNDVWPCTSWAIVDYYRRPKLGFYAISRAMRPLTLITRRLTDDPKPNPKVEALVRSKSSKIREAKLHSTPQVYPEKKSHVEVAVSSIEPEGRSQLRVVVEYVSVATGEKRTVFDEGELKVPGNATVELFDEPVPEEEATVVFARLFCGEELVDMVSDWPQPLKFVDLSTEAKIEISVATVHEEEEEEEGKPGAVVISMNTDRPVKSLVFEERDGERWADNGVDVMPGQVYTITVNDVQPQAEKAWEPKGWSRYGMW